MKGRKHPPDQIVRTEADASVRTLDSGQIDGVQTPESDAGRQRPNGSAAPPALSLGSSTPKTDPTLLPVPKLTNALASPRGHTGHGRYPPSTAATRPRWEDRPVPVARPDRTKILLHSPTVHHTPSDARRPTDPTPYSTLTNANSLPHGETAPQRRHRMTDFVLAEGSVPIQRLAELFGVSLMTTYRDVAHLERQGIIRKFRGGITAQPSSVFESNVRYRLAVHREQKEAIARRAIAFVEPGMSVILDDGTTLLPLARLLTTVAPLTVITNFVPTLSILRDYPSINLIALGGTYQPTHDCFAGSLCVAAIEHIHADLLFLSASAISSAQVFHQEQEIVSTKRAMLRSSREHFLLADHTKLGKTALFQVARLDVIDRFITDDEAEPELLKQFADANVTYEKVGR